MKNWLDQITPFLVIFFAVCLFWSRLFFPEPQLLVTPDFGRSDAWHFSFATKYFLAESLKRNELPLWSAALGGGFPLLAEGQIGALFLPNLILFKFLDPVTAYNLSLILAILLIGWGTYAWLRLLNLDKIPACFGGLTLAFSGPVVTQLTHITLLEGFSLLPWVLIGTALLVKNRSFLAVVVAAVLISQQLLAGFPQASFITLILAGSYFLWLISRASSKFILIARALLAVFLSAGLSAVQLLPSWEFLNYSVNPSGFSPADAAYFSYPIRQLITFLNPYLLGNPKLGTYPVFSAFSGSIFWENTGFVGILPLVAAGVFLIACRKNKHYAFAVTVLVISLLLMLGSHGPLYIIYSFWPFNLFRVPSRFIWIFVFILVSVSSFGLQVVWDKIKNLRLPKILFLVFLVLNFFSLLGPWINYHDLVPAGLWLAAPETRAWIPTQSRLVTIGSEVSYNSIFLKTGWQDQAPYAFLRNLISPDSNLFWNVTVGEVYAGRMLQRQAVLKSLVEQEIKLSANEATISALGTKLLRVASIDKVLTALALNHQDLVGQNAVRQNHRSLTGYANPQALPPAYLAWQIETAQTAEEASRKLAATAFIPGKSVLLPQILSVEAPAGESKISLKRAAETEVIVDVTNNPGRAILVLNDTYYPGWQASLDGENVAIYPANINFRAVVIPAGTHRVVFTYRSESFRRGALISGLTALLLTSGVVFLQVCAVFRIRQKTAGPARHRRRSPARSIPHKN